ncbi:MAG: LysM peptidoglycan-binding domain-containing protein [Clostridium sp.]|nr:LysM peptidoglycan-binding domain-containing protein [Clostridium sp.]
MDATWTVPKNIRQIGEAHAHYAIYIEDYVSTYIKQVVRLSDGGIRQGALVGKVYPDEGKTVFVIEGIVTDKEAYRTREELFSAAGREALQGQCGQYFSGSDMIGEVIFDSEKDGTDMMRRGMLSEAGARKLLLHVDCADGAQKFYIGSQGAVEIVESYYIYYDRNEAMQNYLIAYNEETRRKVEEVHDIISGQARAAMGEFHLPRARMSKDTPLICVTCALLICVSLLGIININQYQKMCEMQESFQHVLVSLGFTDDDAVPAASDAARQDGTASGSGTALRDEENPNGYIVSDITPEDGITVNDGNAVSDGIAAGDAQNGLFDGLPIYVSNGNGGDVDAVQGQGTGENDPGQASGENVPGADVSGQAEGGNGRTEAAGQEVGENAAGQTSGENAPGADVSDQVGNGNGRTEVTGQEAGENVSEQPEGGSHTADASHEGNDDALAMGGDGAGGTYREYVIQRGDTLTSISMHFYQNRNMIRQICALNGIENADNIVAGQKILLP